MAVKRFVNTGYLPFDEPFINQYQDGYLGGVLYSNDIFVAYDTDGVPYLTASADLSIAGLIKGDKGDTGAKGDTGDLGPVVALGNISGTVSLSSYTLSAQTFSLTATGNITCTAASWPAPVAGKTGSFSIRIKQDATGSRLVTIDPSILSSYGNDPVLTTTANAVDILTFFWTGTEWVVLLTGSAVV